MRAVGFSVCAVPHTWRCRLPTTTEAQSLSQRLAFLNLPVDQRYEWPEVRSTCSDVSESVHTGERPRRNPEMSAPGPKRTLVQGIAGARGERRSFCDDTRCDVLRAGKPIVSLAWRIIQMRVQPFDTSQRLNERGARTEALVRASFISGGTCPRLAEKRRSCERCRNA